MGNDPDSTMYELICVIVNYGVGSKVLKIGRQYGIENAVVYLGTGTVKSRVLEFLALADIRKEVILTIASEPTAHAALQKIHEELALHKPYHGIAFTMPVPAFLGAGKRSYHYRAESRGVDTMYNVIFVIVDKGKGDLAMDAATKAGAKGGTIIKARGTGINQASKLFQMDIEPEKEVLMILAEEGITEKIATAVCNELEIDKPGNGIIFCQAVNKTYGVQ